MDHDPIIAASYHCDKHVIKMILESAQLLSTAHRVLDGQKQAVVSATGRNGTRYVHPTALADESLYSATHINHPSAVWVRESADNYNWLWELTKELNTEFIQRYSKQQDHLSIQKLECLLCDLPNKIPKTKFTEPTQCMPEEYKVKGDSVQAYRNYYIGAKSDIARWSNSPTPYWF